MTNTSIEITNNGECKNNSINDNVTKEEDKGQSYKVDQLEKDQEKHQYGNTKKGDFITIIEMEDITPNKRQTSSPTKSLTTPTEKRTQKMRKHDGNQSTDVTIKMYNNLKGTMNKMDNEMNEFSNRYSVEQSVITEEITDTLKNFITPLTKENAQLKLELEAANKRIENLNSQLLDVTNGNANKVKELKSWVSCKLEAVECNNYQLSEQLQIVKKTTKSLKEQSKTNKRNQILDPVAKDRATQASNSIKNASKNSLEIARPDLKLQ